MAVVVNWVGTFLNHSKLPMLNSDLQANGHLAISSTLHSFFQFVNSVEHSSYPMLVTYPVGAYEEVSAVAT